MANIYSVASFVPSGLYTFSLQALPESYKVDREVHVRFMDEEVKDLLEFSQTMSGKLRLGPRCV